MNYTTPEKKGISSAAIEKYVKILEDTHLITHNIIISVGDYIVYENYRAPFHKDFLHRMYSVTKSFVSLAIGFAEQDGLIDLDDKIIKYFPDELKNQTDENMKNQTIRHMLMMSTCKYDRNWFEARCEDRVKYYFTNDLQDTHPSGTIYLYDSTGSFVLGALVERVTGKTLDEYLREKLFDKIGVSEEAHFLKCPGGHSWGDSGLICKPSDLWKTARFCMNKGKHNGEQILNEEYITKATSKQISNTFWGTNEYADQGYGYQFWRVFDNSYMFNGMGCQFAICVPDKDIVMVYNGDNQGLSFAKSTIIDNFFDIVVSSASIKTLPENEEAQKSLAYYSESLKLFALKGEKTSPFAEKVNNVTYKLNKNSMGITKMKLSFEGDSGVLSYTNEQGNKEIPFKMCDNAFSKFPQAGYSDMIGSQKGERLYDCAASAAWTGERELLIKVQIIDTYFGILNINIGFTEDNKLGLYMSKIAEDFLNEYQGHASGTAQTDKD